MITDAHPLLHIRFGRHGVSFKHRRYGGAVDEPTHPSIEEHAADMGVDPDELRAFLQAADHTPPRPDQRDDRDRLWELLDRP